MAIIILLALIAFAVASFASVRSDYAVAEVEIVTEMPALGGFTTLLNVMTEATDSTMPVVRVVRPARRQRASLTRLVAQRARSFA